MLHEAEGAETGYGLADASFKDAPQAKPLQADRDPPGKLNPELIKDLLRNPNNPTNMTISCFLVAIKPLDNILREVVTDTSPHYHERDLLRSVPSIAHNCEANLTAVAKDGDFSLAPELQTYITRLSAQLWRVIAEVSLCLSDTSERDYFQRRSVRECCAELCSLLTSGMLAAERQREGREPYGYP